MSPLFSNQMCNHYQLNRLLYAMTMAETLPTLNLNFINCHFQLQPFGECFMYLLVDKHNYSRFSTNENHDKINGWWSVTIPSEYTLSLQRAYVVRQWIYVSLTGKENCNWWCNLEFENGNGKWEMLVWKISREEEGITKIQSHAMPCHTKHKHVFVYWYCKLVNQSEYMCNFTFYSMSM